MPSFVRDHPLASQLQTAAPQRVGSSTASSQFDISIIDPTVKLPKKSEPCSKRTVVPKNTGWLNGLTANQPMLLMPVGLNTSQIEYGW